MDDSQRRGEFARRYSAWIGRNHLVVLGIALVVALVSGLLVAGLPVRFDVKNLLPESRQSVRDLKMLQDRAKSFGALYIMIEAKTPETRVAAEARLIEELEGLDSSLVSRVVDDDSGARSYFWANRFLFVGVDELTEVRDALREKVKRAALAANPLFITLEDDDTHVEEVRVSEDRIAHLRARLREAEEKSKSSARLVSPSGLLQLLILRTPFSSTEVRRGAKLLTEVDRAFDRVRADFHEEVQFGVAGPIVANVYEQRSILRGMVLAAGVTMIVVAAALFLYYRSVLTVLAALWSLTVGVGTTFAFTRLTIGHLNLMTAFLAAIVVGNGINSSLILLARYFEERRQEHAGSEALARAIAGAGQGTLAAALTAAAAYGSLAVTDFRGFRHFGIIAAVGMVLCWISAFTVLPAALVFLERRKRVRVGREPAIGALLARLLPSSFGWVVGVALVVSLVSGVIAYRYISTDPFLKDWRVLRPSSAELQDVRSRQERMKREFDASIFQGQTNTLLIALPTAEAADDLARQLRRDDELRLPGHKLFTSVRGLGDLLPNQQEEKLALLADISEFLSDERMGKVDAAELETIRPPSGLVVLTPEDIPNDLSWPFIERDGSAGRLLLVAGDRRFKAWNVDDRVAFATAIRGLQIPADAVVGGQPFVVADIIASMEEDAPLVILVALLGALLTVWMVVGLGRHGWVTLACGGGGVVTMIALCSLVGLKVHFLDLIALPITIGIGIDYAVNLAARQRHSPALGDRALLRSTGGAVALCSFTTIVGYGSLLLSENGGIRSFGLASILGEFSCVVFALFLAPKLLAGRHRDS